MQSHSLEKILKIIKVILWLIPVFVFICILNQHFVLNGKFEIKYDVVKGSKLISNFASKEPDKLIGTKNSLGNNDYFQLITVEPVYFDVKVPRPFQKATVTLKYQNPNNQPAIQLGVKQSNGAFYNKSMAFYNSFLENMPDYWNKIQEGDTYLWQKNKPKFSNINEFLNNLPEKNKIAQFNYSLAPYIEMPNYQKSSKTTEIDKTLRGKHEIYTYLGKGEDLNFTFTIQDINRQIGADVTKVSVFNNKNEKVKEVSLADDGDTMADNKIFPERNLSVSMKNMPFGVYRLVIDCPDEIFIKKIVTAQHLLMFKGHVFLTDNENYKSILGDKQLTANALYTNGSYVIADTPHSSGFQNLKIGKKIVKLEEIKVTKEVSNLNGITTIVSPLNDVGLNSDGFFTFSQDQFFDANFATVDSLDSINNIDLYDYIIAYYPRAEQDGDWLLAQTTISSPQLYFHKDGDVMANFIISLPGLYENHRFLKIKEITIRFEKEPITIHNFFPKLKSFINRLIKS